jgi:RNA polymerase sigma factor for flagellar operon FliA
MAALKLTPEAYQAYLLAENAELIASFDEVLQESLGRPTARRARKSN